MSSATQAPEGSFAFLPQGALIQEFAVAGHNIILSLPTVAAYATHNQAYCGETIGRTTNRIRGGRIPDLNGKTYQLATNDAPRPNLLHGGNEGWGKKAWDGPKPVSRHGKEGVQFTYLSPDGDEGYPGSVEARVWYVAGMETGEGGRRDTVLEVEYEVEFVGDECEETVVGMTNHSYFTLSPTSPTTAGTCVILATAHHLELDDQAIPTGKIVPHPAIPSSSSSTPTTPSFTLGETSPSFDDCFILPPRSGPPNNFDAIVATIPLDTRPLPLRTLCALSHPDTGLHLEIESTEPAFQFYTGEGIDVPPLPKEGGGGAGEMSEAMGARKGIAIEPSRYVDCAGRSEWRGMCTLRKGSGQVWGSRSRYTAWKE